MSKDIRDTLNLISNHIREEGNKLKAQYASVAEPLLTEELRFNEFTRSPSRCHLRHQRRLIRHHQGILPWLPLRHLRWPRSTPPRA